MRLRAEVERTISEAEQGQRSVWADLAEPLRKNVPVILAIVAAVIVWDVLVGGDSSFILTRTGILE